MRVPILTPSDSIRLVFENIYGNFVRFCGKGSNRSSRPTGESGGTGPPGESGRTRKSGARRATGESGCTGACRTNRACRTTRNPGFLVLEDGTDYQPDLQHSVLKHGK